MRQLILSLIGFGLVGCAGNAPSNQGDDAPEPDASVEPDAAPEAVGKKLSGKTMEFDGQGKCAAGCS